MKISGQAQVGAASRRVLTRQDAAPGSAQAGSPPSARWPNHGTRQDAASASAAPRARPSSRNLPTSPFTLAFTLIELLAAITILMMIVSVLGVIFAESNRAWTVGTGHAESNTEGRAAVNQIAQDLQYALADDILTFRMRIDGKNVHDKPSTIKYPWPPVSYGYTNSEISFVALAGDAAPTLGSSEAQRSTRAIYYWVREATTNSNNDGVPLGTYELMRTEVSTHGDNPAAILKQAYHNTKWFEDESKGGAGDRSRTATTYGVIAQNIAAVAFYAPTNTLGAQTLSRDYDSRDYTNLPPYVDVFVEVLSTDDALKAADMELRLRQSPGNKALQRTEGEFVEKHAQRYTTRVFFQNRSGYKVR